MDSLDAQCLVFGLITRGADPPDIWCHGRDGSLTWAFEGSENWYTWQAEEVRGMAEEWRATGQEPPEHLQRFVDAHLAFERLLERGSIEPPDTVAHNLPRRAIRAKWSDRKLIVEIDDIGEVDVERSLAEKMPM